MSKTDYIFIIVRTLGTLLIMMTLIGCDGGWSVGGLDIPEKL
jgi:hypothetical protein|tara:strand:+ start:421 stop:546 length:126 start_codon:yes stop_codon:yes gene_type:complete